MNRRLRFHKELLVIGGALILVSLFIEVINRQPVNPDPMELYQFGMVQIITGLTGLLGCFVLLAAVIVALVRKQSRPGKCASCGAIIARPSDAFCRSCGAPLAK